MEEKQDTPQRQSGENQENSHITAPPQDWTESVSKQESSRPRIIAPAERAVQREEKRVIKRANREINETRPPVASTYESMSQHEKHMLEAKTVEAIDTQIRLEKVRIIEDRELVKWAAWAALLVSLATLFLLGLYSARDFGPVFEYHDLEVTQKQLEKDVYSLKHSTQLENIENAIIHAQFEIFVRKDYTTAETILEGAKADLKQYIDSLPIEKTVEPKQILSYIDRAIQDVRRGPSSIDENLRTISENLAKIRKQ